MRDGIKFMRDKMGMACDVHFRENLYITLFFRYNNKPYIATMWRVLEILEGILKNICSFGKNVCYCLQTCH